MPDTIISSLGMKLTVPEVVQEIMAFMGADLMRKYRVTIGTDSQLLASKNADFVNAVVVHRIGNGGRYIYRSFELGNSRSTRTSA